MEDKLSQEYQPSEWTPCPPDCAYCSDPFYGHPKPHDTQRRITDGKSPQELRSKPNGLVNLTK